MKGKGGEMGKKNHQSQTEGKEERAERMKMENRRDKLRWQTVNL